MRVAILHGKETGPGGTKIQELAKVAGQLGHDLFVPDMSDTQDPELRTMRLIEALKGDNQPLVLVGSSMGGYVAMAAAAELDPLAMLLIAPAIGKPGYRQQRPFAPPGCRIVIAHGWQDETNPVDASIGYAREFGCELHLINDRHRMTADICLLERLLKRLLTGC